jgi:NAD(P)-dependent dehydrogenase (short-subunit alcohol dehydrogenase family)
MYLSKTKALITGASRGLGAVTNQTFLNYGADVVATSKSGKNNTAKCDLTADAAAKQIIYFADTFFMSELNTIVCNAGIYGPIGPVEDNNWNEWKEAIETNLFAVVNLCRYAVPIFKKQRRGKIIILSGGGATKPMANFSAYAASKAAVVRFAETLAEEVRDYNIQVNCVAPGSMNTSFMEKAIHAGPEKAGKDFHDRMLKQQVEGGDSMQNAAELIAFLASEESNHITGRLISAVWDDWKNLNLKDNMYTLRRIDKESML